MASTSSPELSTPSRASYLIFFEIEEMVICLALVHSSSFTGPNAIGNRGLRLARGEPTRSWQSSILTE